VLSLRSFTHKLRQAYGIALQLNLMLGGRRIAAQKLGTLEIIFSIIKIKK
jgi:hypothetical protein